MRPLSYPPLCTALLLLIQFTPPLTHAAGLFPYGLENGDTFAWEDDVHDDYELITIERPFNFNGVMWNNISVRISHCCTVGSRVRKFCEIRQAFTFDLLLRGRVFI